MPSRCSDLSCVGWHPRVSRRNAKDADALDGTGRGALDEKLEIALSGAGSGTRNAPELPEQETGDGLVVRVVEGGSQIPLERRQRIRAFHEERRSVAFGAARGLVVLVEDVTHDLLDQVLQCDEAGHGATIAHDDRHVETA